MLALIMTARASQSNLCNSRSLSLALARIAHLYTYIYLVRMDDSRRGWTAVNENFWRR